MDFAYLKSLLPSVEELQEGLQDLVRNIADEIPTVQGVTEGIQNLNAGVQEMVNESLQDLGIDWNSQENKTEATNQNFIASMSLSNPQNLGLFHSIPVDLMLVIFSWLDVSALSQTLFVCRTWFFLSNDDNLWKNIFQRDMYSWNVFRSFNEISPSSWQPLMNSLYISQLFGPNKEVEIENWKQRYYFQYKFNKEKYKEHVKKNTKPVLNENNAKLDMDPWSTTKNSFNLSFGKKSFRLLFIGEGVVKTAKKFVYDMMWGSNSSFKMISLFPGNSGIGSGVGFEFNNATLNISSVSSDEEFLKKVKESQLFRETEALVYVMDSNSILEDQFEKLKYILDPELGISPDVPLLIFSCRTNPESDEGEIFPAKISQKLKLDQLKRKWCISRFCEGTMEGTYEGLDWLISVL